MRFYQLISVNFSGIKILANNEFNDESCIELASFLQNSNTIARLSICIN